MTDRKNYIAPFKLNEPMEGSAIGEVIETNSELFFSLFLLQYGI